MVFLKHTLETGTRALIRDHANFRNVIKKKGIEFPLKRVSTNKCKWTTNFLTGGNFKKCKLVATTINLLLLNIKIFSLVILVWKNRFLRHIKRHLLWYNFHTFNLKSFLYQRSCAKYCIVKVYFEITVSSRF